MRMHDVNVLIYAHRRDMPRHARFRELLEDEINGEQTYAVCDFVINGFLRIVTNRRVFPQDPTPMKDALAFADQVRHQPHAVTVAPGPRHWPIFTRLVNDAGVDGEDLPDAYLAAVAIEHGCELVTVDKGFKRFGGSRLHSIV